MGAVITEVGRVNGQLRERGEGPLNITCPHDAMSS